MKLAQANRSTLSSRRITPHVRSRNWVHGGCDRSTGDACSAWAPDPTSTILGGLVLAHFLSDLQFLLVFEFITAWYLGHLLSRQLLYLLVGDV
jgi:hypothetical protein